ncbi:MAG: MFS transporter, partial [bacterium]|nr:MFS transporter [bacterium]
DVYKRQPTKEVLLYAFGNIESSISNQFFSILQTVMVVAMRINPLILGVVLGIKTFWDAVTDPVMAQITDNFKSRWGRRRPFILVGGIGRSALVAVLIIWFPKVHSISSNRVLEGDKQSITLLARAERATTTLTNYLALLARSSVCSDVVLEKDLDALRRDYRKITNMYGRLMPDILADFHKRQERLARMEQSFSNAMAFGDAKLLSTKKLNCEHAQTMVNNARQVITRLDKAMAVAKASEELLVQVDVVRAGRRAGSDAVAFVPGILRAIGGEGVPDDLSAAAQSVRRAGQTLLLVARLAARGEGCRSSEAAWQAALTAMKESASAEVFFATNATRLNELVVAAEEAVRQSLVYTNASDVLEAGIARGRLVYAQERLAALTNLCSVAAQASAQRAAASLLHQYREGRLNTERMRGQVEALLTGYVGPMSQETSGKSTLQELIDAWRIFWDPDNRDTRSVTLYVLVGLLLFTTFTTIQSVPYYALGIELCPSYDGRTRVVMYRSIVDHVVGVIAPYVPVFCFLLYFRTALDGLFYVALLACSLGIPATILMVVFVKERMSTVISKRQLEHHMGIIQSFISLCKNPNFLRIIFLYNFLGLVQGMFLPLGGYLNIYWVMGSAGAGARIAAYVGTFCWVLGLINLPALKWACEKFQKHVVMRWAVILMSIGTILNFFCLRKGHPEYQFIVPIFYSVGIASYYMVLATMMADVTDHDELVTGFRREGMFGAINAFIIKIVNAISAVLPGIVLVLSGFDPVLEYNQTPATIMRMRIMNSFVPGILTLGCLLVLWRYPLTRERVEEIKEVLRRRRAERAAMEGRSN